MHFILLSISKRTVLFIIIKVGALRCHWWWWWWWWWWWCFFLQALCYFHQNYLRSTFQASGVRVLLFATFQAFLFLISYYFPAVWCMMLKFQVWTLASSTSFFFSPIIFHHYPPSINNSCLKIQQGFSLMCNIVIRHLFPTDCVFCMDVSNTKVLSIFLTSFYY